MNRIVIILLFAFCLKNVFAKTFLIYNISQDIPMGYDNEVIKKNFYVNVGSLQGVDQGTLLSVYRTIARNNPYGESKRVNYKVKIGEVKIIHVEENHAIAELHSLEKDGPTYFEVRSLMIGDHVAIKVD